MKKNLTIDLVDTYSNLLELAECVENDEVYMEMKKELANLRTVLKNDFGIEFIVEGDTITGVYFDRSDRLTF